jgi:hypothetical protein
METPLRFSIDRFVVFMGAVHLRGWAFSPEVRIRRIALVLGSGAELEFSNFGLDSEDVVRAFGEDARDARFDEHWFCEAETEEITNGKIVVDFSNGSRHEVDHLGQNGVAADPAHTETQRFFDRLRTMEPGKVLEIGSRARSGVTRKHLIPDAWQYVGFDIVAGENVSIVGDAHQLSKIFPRSSFRAVMAFSVLEHILMPWKLAIELNKVMELNGVGYLTTHQCWPLHDEPWDFWRFSTHCWKALFNERTGFEILVAQSGEPAFIVANHHHAVTNFSAAPGAFLSSVVLFRKISETSLEWDVEPSTILDTPYPALTTTIQH